MAALNLYRYAELFRSKDIKGVDLLSLDKDKLAVILFLYFWNFSLAISLSMRDGRLYFEDSKSVLWPAWIYCRGRQREFLVRSDSDALAMCQRGPVRLIRWHSSRPRRRQWGLAYRVVCINIVRLCYKSQASR